MTVVAQVSVQCSTPMISFIPHPVTRSSDYNAQFAGEEGVNPRDQVAGGQHLDGNVIPLTLQHRSRPLSSPGPCPVPPPTTTQWGSSTLWPKQRLVLEVIRLNL